MSQFQSGDRVLLDGSLVVTVKVFDEAAGQVVLVQDLPGGATNEIYGPIAAYAPRLQHLVAVAVGSDVRPGEDAPAETPAPAEPEVEAEGPQDEITTSGFLS